MDNVGSLVGRAGKSVATILGALFRLLVDCGDVCSGTWDMSCFLEHLCMVSLAKLFIFPVVSFAMLYLMCKVGLKCVLKRASKAGMSVCSSSCHALRFLCRKLRSTKRVRRGRRWYDDVEEGWSSGEDGSSEGRSVGHGRGRRSRARAGSSPPPVRERRHDRMRHSQGPRKPSFKDKATARRSHALGGRAGGISAVSGRGRCVPTAARRDDI